MKKILLTSVSDKTPLIQAIKYTLKTNNLDLKVIGGDYNEDVIAKYFVDDFWHMPALKELQINEVIDYCLENSINYILPTREEDLLYFGRHRNILSENNIYTMVSNEEAIKDTIDKLVFYQKLNKLGFPVIPTFTSIKELNSEFFVVKERFGSGSKQIAINIDANEAASYLLKLEHPIIQPFIKGKEYSVDLYLTKSRVVKAIVVRERVYIKDGESQITEITRHPAVENLIQKAAKSLNLEGHVMFQVIETNSGHLYIVECNPRIGGASTLSIYAGLDSFNWWLDECNNLEIERLPVNIKKLKLIRYKKDLIF